MIPETKFDINDDVFRIANQKKQSFAKCKVCNGIGRITVKDKGYQCPECYGRGGEWVYGPDEWQCIGAGRVGQVRTETTNIEADDMFSNVGHYQEGSTKTEIKYMLYGSSVGSGTVWEEENLFATQKEAEEECEKRNEEIS